MKKKILLTAITGVVLGITLMSDSGGPANGGAGNRTGVNGSTTNCGGGGCHGGNSASTTATIRVDSVGGVSVNEYVAGMTYTVTITGTNSSLTKYGFQFAAVSGTTTQVNAGTFGTSLPTQVAKHTLSSISYIEQSSAITGPLSKVFTWTAPATNVGSVKMYLTVNAVNGDGNANAADLSGNVSKTLTFYTPPTIVGCVANPGSGPIAYPNPTFNELNLQMDNPYSTHAVQVIDITGRTILNTQIAANATGLATLNTSAWATGLYKVIVSDETSQEVVSIVKQ